MRHLGNRVLFDPTTLKREFQEVGDDAAPVVVGLERRFFHLPEIEIRNESLGRKVGDVHFGEVAEEAL